MALGCVKNERVAQPHFAGLSGRQRLGQGLRLFDKISGCFEETN
jgi:hypothetical protein